MKEVLSHANAKSIADLITGIHGCLEQIGDKLDELPLNKGDWKKIARMQASLNDVISAVEDRIYVDEQGKKHLLSELLPSPSAGHQPVNPEDDGCGA